jgi:hypothetical protein
MSRSEGGPSVVGNDWSRFDGPQPPLSPRKRGLLLGCCVWVVFVAAILANPDVRSGAPGCRCAGELLCVPLLRTAVLLTRDALSGDCLVLAGATG